MNQSWSDTVACCQSSTKTTQEEKRIFKLSKMRKWAELIHPVGELPPVRAAFLPKPSRLFSAASEVTLPEIA